MTALSSRPGALSTRLNTKNSMRTRRARIRISLFAATQLVVAFVVLIPIIWMFVAAFRTDADIGTGSLIPHTFTLQNFANVSERIDLPRAFANTTIVAGGSAVITTAISLLAAYALSRFNFRGSRSVMSSVVLAQVIPSLVVLVPLVVIMQRLQLTDSLFGLTLVYLMLGVPISIMLLRAYLDDIPVALDEAAMIDGCNRVQALWHVTMPMLRPAIAAVMIFDFILAWGEYVLALSLITSDQNKTLSLVLSSLFDQYTFNMGTIMAFGLLMSLPVAVLLMLVQKHLVANLVAGSVK